MTALVYVFLILHSNDAIVLSAILRGGLCGADCTNIPGVTMTMLAILYVVLNTNTFQKARLLPGPSTS